MTLQERLGYYSQLMRLNKPIGIFLLLWPTLWALWLASAGKPRLSLLAFFILGVLLMRSAGCVINDVADAHLDGRVARTRERPLAAGKLSRKEALVLFGFLLFLALGLVLTQNRLTLLCACGGAVITVFYPFMKRFTHLPQLGLGVAFAWGIPMAFAAQQGEIPGSAWVLFAAALLWPVIYDTFYAMTDRDDDLKIGIKSTAILFAGADRSIIAFLQLLFLAGLVLVGVLFQRSFPYYLGLGLVALLFLYQQVLIIEREPAKCFQAFHNNNAVGALIFIGLVLSYL